MRRKNRVRGHTPHPVLCHTMFSRCTLMIGRVALATLPFFFLKAKNHSKAIAKNKNLIGGVTPHPDLCHNVLSRCTLMIGGVALATLPFSF
jgi:hypothetical protein